MRTPRPSHCVCLCPRPLIQVAAARQPAMPAQGDIGGSRGQQEERGGKGAGSLLEAQGWRQTQPSLAELANRYIQPNTQSGALPTCLYRKKEQPAAASPMAACRTQCCLTALGMRI
jgi:hypothetical protein